MIKVRPDELPDRIESMLARLKETPRKNWSAFAAPNPVPGNGHHGNGQDIGDARLWTFRFRTGGRR